MSQSVVTLDAAVLSAMSTLCANDPKTLSQIALKTAEEVGELAQAVLCVEGVPGSGFREKTILDVQEEAVDVFLCSWSMIVKSAISQDSLELLVQKKLKKWQAALSIMKEGADR